MKFRILQTGFQNAAFNMALDEVLIERIARGESKPALRLYRWKPAAISIGYFQSLQAEVDETRCQALGIDIIRRQTGGGAVLHDQEITYSMHIPLSFGLVPQTILDSYQKISEGIIQGLAILWLRATFVPLNDIVVNGQKISGNAQTRKQGILLQHGTILKSVDVDRMFEVLKVPQEKMKGKLIADIKQRVTSIDQQLKRETPFQVIEQALIKGFATAFPKIEFESDTLTSEEITATQALSQAKYAKSVWNHQR